MAYTIKFQTGAAATLSGLPSTTDVVWVHTAVLAKITAAGGGQGATRNGSQFTFTIGGGKFTQQNTVTLDVGTLAGAAVGGLVLAADYTGQWNIAFVISDGTNTAGPGGISLPPTTPAAGLVTANSPVAPLPGTVLTFIGAAAGGQMWFLEGPQLYFVTNPVTTLGLLAPGQVVVAQVDAGPPATWQAVQL